jgi:hypothetical protein
VRVPCKLWTFHPISNLKHSSCNVMIIFSLYIIFLPRLYRVLSRPLFIAVFFLAT